MICLRARMAPAVSLSARMPPKFRPSSSPAIYPLEHLFDKAAEQPAIEPQNRQKGRCRSVINMLGYQWEDKWTESSRDVSWLSPEEAQEGRAAVQLFARLGAHVVLAAQGAHRGQEVATQLQAEGCHVLFVSGGCLPI
jgi:hypothetical protein